MNIGVVNKIHLGDVKLVNALYEIETLFKSLRAKEISLMGIEDKLLRCDHDLQNACMHVQSNNVNPNIRRFDDIFEVMSELQEQKAKEKRLLTNGKSEIQKLRTVAYHLAQHLRQAEFDRVLAIRRTYCTPDLISETVFTRSERSDTDTALYIMFLKMRDCILKGEKADIQSLSSFMVHKACIPLAGDNTQRGEHGTTVSDEFLEDVPKTMRNVCRDMRELYLRTVVEHRHHIGDQGINLDGILNPTSLQEYLKRFASVLDQMLVIVDNSCIPSTRVTAPVGNESSNEFESDSSEPDGMETDEGPVEAATTHAGVLPGPVVSTASAVEGTASAVEGTASAVEGTASTVEGTASAVEGKNVM
jgi:hypothetical protein